MNMTNQIQFELASPQKMIFAKPVAMAIIPGCEGRYGVLAGHAPMATKLDAGIVEIYENDTLSLTERYFVTGGFCEVVTGRCTVLADQILQIKDLVAADIQGRMKDLLAQANEVGTEEEREHIADLLVIERAKLLAAA